MATAKKLPSGQWRTLAYSHIDATGKRHYESFTASTKKESEYLAAEFSYSKKGKAKGKLTFGDALTGYISRRKQMLSPRSIAEYTRVMNTDLLPLNGKNLYKLTPEDIQKLIDLLSQTQSPKTVRCTHGLIAAVFGECRPDFPLHTILPKNVRPKIHIPTNAEVLEVMNNAEPVMRRAILLAAFGPMRRGEICALDSEHINGNIVHIEKNMVLNTDKTWILKAPKTLAGNRYITMPDSVMSEIKSISGRIVDINPDELSCRFRRLVKNSDVIPFRFHDLRHYGASTLHALGVPDQYIISRGGWETDSTLKTVYRHTMSDHEKAMNDIANNYFDNLCNTPCNTHEKKPPK